MTHAIDPADIEHYLKQYPDFFETREDLLAELRVPHNSGKAVSLVEKQLTVLRERNAELRNRLTGLIGTARDNDKLFTHTRRLVLSLLDAAHLSQAIDIIYGSFANDFGVEKTQIILFDNPTICGARNETLSNAQQHIGKYLKSRQTVGGGLGVNERRFLFKENADDIGSAALAVLSYNDIYGVIAIGNQDPSYYQSSMGTLFLSYVAEILSRVLRRFAQR